MAWFNIIYFIKKQHHQMIKKDSSDCMEMVFKRNGVRGKYTKFSKEHQNMMKSLFEENYYPSKSEYDRLAEELNESVDKIINWFKHERRKYLNTQNIESYKKRKIFTKEEEIVLEASFKENPRPPAIKYTELSQITKCTRKQIRKWFSYRRIKLEQLRERQNSVPEIPSRKTNAKTFNMTLRPNRPKSNKLKTHATEKFPKKKPLSFFLKIKRKTGFNPNFSKQKLCPPMVPPESKTPENLTSDLNEPIPNGHNIIGNNASNILANPKVSSFNNNNCLNFLLNFLPYPSNFFQAEPSIKPTDFLCPPPLSNPYRCDYLDCKFSPSACPSPSIYPYQANSMPFNPLIGMNQGISPNLNLAYNPLLMNYIKSHNSIINHLNFLQSLKNLQARNRKI